MRFVLEGEPHAAERPRYVRRIGIAYTPPRTKSACAAIGLAYRAAGGCLIDGAVSIKAVFRTGRHSAAHLDPRDVDNLLKTVLDGLSGVAYSNDRRVIMVVGVKLVDRTNPRTEVDVNEVADVYETARFRRTRCARPSDP